MRYIKPLSVALITLGLSSVVLAADSNVTIPSQHGGFKFSIDPLYFHKNAINISNDDTDYEWGIDGKISYLFPATGNDLTFDYTYLRSDEKESVDLDTGDLEIGQRLTAGVFDIRLFSGMRYSHLNYDLDMSTPKNKQSLNSLFHGFGPMVGADARYQLSDCFSCFGLDTHIDTSFMVGTLNTKYQNQDLIVSNHVSHLVPEMNAKIGVDYTYPFQCGGKSAFVLEVGYQTSNYFNALDKARADSSPNVSFDGAYFDIKYYA